MKSDRERRKDNIEAALKGRYKDAAAVARVVLPEIMGARCVEDRNGLAEFVVRTFCYPNGEPVGERSASEGLTDAQFDTAEAEVGEIAATFIVSVRDGNGTGAEFGSRLVGLLESCSSVHARIYALGMVLQSDIVPFMQIVEGDFEGALDRATAKEVGNRVAVCRSALAINRIFQLKDKTRGQRIAAVRRVLARHKDAEFDYLLNHAARKMASSALSLVEVGMLDGSGGYLLGLFGMGHPPPVETPREGEGIGDVILWLERSFETLLSRGKNNNANGGANGHDGEARNLFSDMSVADLKRLMMFMSNITEEKAFERVVVAHDPGCNMPDCIVREYIRARDAEAKSAQADDGDSRAKQARERI